MTQLTRYSPDFSEPKRLDINRIQIMDGDVIITIAAPADDDRAEIVAELIKAIPAMLRALRSIESYAEVTRQSPASLAQVKEWATEALEAANWKE